MLRSIFFFDAMLVPKIITGVYWFLLVGVMVSGLGMMFAGSFFGGLMVLLFGAVGVRIWCELLIVLFKINDHLKKMVDKP